MSRFPLILFIAILILGLTACQSNNQDKKDDVDLTGIWEARPASQKVSNGTLEVKGEITFSDNNYQQSWYKKLTAKDGSVIYDWSESARETGWDSITSGYMQWTANFYGTAEYDEETRMWSAINMWPSTNTHSIFFSLKDDQLTLKEDYNLDGNFNAVVDGQPETLVYFKKE